MVVLSAVPANNLNIMRSKEAPMNITIPKVTLSNGYAIPSLGFGTWQTPDGQTAVNAVKTAIAAGYRHIDTAAIYGSRFIDIRFIDII